LSGSDGNQIGTQKVDYDALDEPSAAKVYSFPWRETAKCLKQSDTHVQKLRRAAFVSVSKGKPMTLHFL